jgi:hypothetical protein
LRNYVAAQPKSSNFPAMSAELRDALNLLSANSYDQNTARWGSQTAPSMQKMKSGESGFDAFKAWTGPGRMQIKIENRQILYNSRD